MIKPATPEFSLEVCANSYASAKAAQNGGASRVELCENMAEGGTTPSYAQIKLCKKNLHIQIWPIIRPRGGDFLYSNDEFEIMKEDIKLCKLLNCDGVVTGLLMKNGEIDKKRCAELIELAKPMPMAFHRAFDMSNDLETALNDLIDLGFVRVLTSGAAKNAIDAMEILAQLVKQAEQKIEVMPGSGINPSNILEIKEKTGAKTFHASARTKIASSMLYQNHTSKMGHVADEYEHEQTSVQLVAEMVHALN